MLIIGSQHQFHVSNFYIKRSLGKNLKRTHNNQFKLEQ